MTKKRIDYIDYLKGLSIIWVVWYHTNHPWFVDFSFRMPLFFLASGIFFKVTDFGTYLRKKITQLVVPFVFFSLVYYLYLILQHYLGYGSLQEFDFGCIWGVFEAHRGTQSFAVDPPLWFICALICQQLMTIILSRVLRSRWLIMIVAICITVIGKIYLVHEPTYFMFGRSMPYLVYYISGFLFGKDLLKVIEQRNATSYIPLYAAVVVFLATLIMRIYVRNLDELLIYFETFGLIVMLVYMFRYIYKFHFARPFWFFGRNSYIVLGLHEIYMTIFRIVIIHLFGFINVWIGMAQTIAALLCLVPTINLLNRRIPKFVGKADFGIVGKLSKNKYLKPLRALL